MIFPQLEVEGLLSFSLLFYQVYHIIVVLSCFSWAIEVTSILLKENSVKPNIRTDRSGFFIR